MASSSLMTEEEALADAAKQPNSRVYSCDKGPAQTFNPWPVSRIRMCVDIIRARMAGDRSEVDEETDKMMVAFCMLHPKMVSMAASTEPGAVAALNLALATWEGVESGSMDKKEAAKRVVQSLASGGEKK
jgi:hypothetical protein